LFQGLERPLCEMLKPVQHDDKRLSFAFCYPEPGPEATNVFLNLFQDQDLTISGFWFWKRGLARLFHILQ
jgi:hypothetical protein